MIPAHCRSNDDDLRREHWPESFVAVPLDGARVRAESGRVAKVASVTHAERAIKDAYGYATTRTEPFIEVELTPIRY